MLDDYDTGGASRAAREAASSEWPLRGLALQMALEGYEVTQHDPSAPRRPAQAAARSAPAAPAPSPGWQISPSMMEEIRRSVARDPASAYAPTPAAASTALQPILYGQASPSLTARLKSMKLQPVPLPPDIYLPPSAANARRLPPPPAAEQEYRGMASSSMIRVLASRGLRPTDWDD
jgi:hypothetical protein